MAGTWADVFSLIDRVKKEYPAAAYLLDHPEVGPLLLKAVAGDYDAATFQQKLYATKYWKTTGDSQRKWDALNALDPATAKQQAAQMRARVRDLSGQMGVPLGLKGRQWIAVTALRNGWDDTQTLDAILRQVKVGDYIQGTGAGSRQRKEIGGDIGATLADIRALGADYGLQVNDMGTFRKALDVAGGTMTMEGVEEFFRQQAVGKFSHLKDIIERGVTPGAFFQSYKEEIASQLEITPDQVDIFNDPKWSEVISHNDGQTIRPMTLSETRRHVRGTKEWKGTRTAQQEGAAMVESLAKMFGAVA